MSASAAGASAGAGGDVDDEDDGKPLTAASLAAFSTAKTTVAKHKSAHKAFQAFLDHCRRESLRWQHPDGSWRVFPASFGEACQAFLVRFLTYSEFVAFMAFTYEFDEKGHVFSFGTLKGYALIIYGLAGGYGHGGGRFSEHPFFKADRDSGNPTIVNQLLARVRVEKAKAAAMKGEDVSSH